MDKVKIGIIGLGNMGSDHAIKISKGKCPNLELVAVSDIMPERTDWAKKELGDQVKCFNDVKELLDSKLIDAVIICSPHYDHPALSAAAFERGIHVLCEKPAGVYTKQVKEMNEAADRAGVVFAMMFQQRTQPAFRKMRELIRSGALGNIRRVNWIMTSWYRPQTYYDSGAWRATWAGEGGGVLLNQCPHNLDLLQWVCGMPSKIRAYCHVGKWHDIEVEDDVTAYMEYSNGATGTFITSTGDSPGTNRFEIALDKGKLVCEDYAKLTLWELDYIEQEYSKKAKSSFDRQEVTKSSYEFPVVKDPHMKIAYEFANAVLNGAPLIADGREGINSLTLSNAMYLSSWTNSEITLPIDEELYYSELMKRIKTSKHKSVKSVFSSTEGSY